MSKNMNIEDLQLHTCIAFTYKGGRQVTGIITRIDEKGLLLKLVTSYSGKNEYWEAGEDKYFNKAEMKDIRLIKPIIKAG